MTLEEDDRTCEAPGEDELNFRQRHLLRTLEFMVEMGGWIAYRRRNREFDSMCELPAFCVGLVWRTVEALEPDFSPARKKRFCSRILTPLEGKDRTPKITEYVIRDMVIRNSQCIKKSCPALLFTEPLVREINCCFSEEE